MASSLFGNNQDPLKRIIPLVKMVKGNPQGAYDYLMSTNPQFARFVNENKGKSADQIAKEHGIDLNALKDILK